MQGPKVDNGPICVCVQTPVIAGTERGTRSASGQGRRSAAAAEGGRARARRGAHIEMTRTAKEGEEMRVMRQVVCDGGCCSVGVSWTASAVQHKVTMHQRGQPKHDENKSWMRCTWEGGGQRVALCKAFQNRTLNCSADASTILQHSAGQLVTASGHYCASAFTLLHAYAHVPTQMCPLAQVIDTIVQLLLCFTPTRMPCHMCAHTCVYREAECR
eukprot:scaffold77285_cov22-Tisochrysis_lutea.AAC.2